ncbi:MAG TPA: hypothetical protein DEB17_05830 [Chlorobaculum sp.]|uniref:Uncharacterized protein n=1 Tax=Chlorobaculum tepidum (strain ATCC 49652 / DSM 12025 / NBRC 103806 / TLS) TaxID=194439 RepID=Q8KF40_CHLTE|nr:hypothetical protein CT0492 [Chlorobaculum tepidum TLS]HBU23505.1 hypothetical protein [Chlorobaculum sp.]
MITQILNNVNDYMLFSAFLRTKSRRDGNWVG